MRLGTARNRHGSETESRDKGVITRLAGDNVFETPMGALDWA